MSHHRTTSNQSDAHTTAAGRAAAGAGGRDRPATASADRTRAELWPAPWASSAATRIDALRGELARACAGRRLNDAEAAVKATVNDLLDVAAAATIRPRGPIRRLLDRWRGTSVERSQSNLHAARIAIVDLLRPDQVVAQVPPALARLAVCLPAGDVRRRSIETQLTKPGSTLTDQRTGLKSALRIGYDASDQLHQRIRGFRNILIAVGATILLFVAAMVAVVAFSPTSVPLCFKPSVTASQASQTPGDDASTRTVCPSGEQSPDSTTARPPAPEDIAIVAGLGLVGGALAAALAIRNLRGTSLPYDVPLALAFLKVPMGALTAVVGIVLLGGGFVPGLSELDSQRQILAYALLLGYAQQVGTQLIDKQAQHLLDSVPSKDPDGKQPAPVTVVPPTDPDASNPSPAAAGPPAAPAAARKNGARTPAPEPVPTV